MKHIRQVDGGVEITVKAVPGASRSKVVGWLGDALKIQVAAPPEKGKANAAIENLLAGLFGVAASSVRITSGTSSPRKMVRLCGMTMERAKEILGEPS